MTGPGTGVVPREEAFGFAQRRSWVFSAWWYPAVLAAPGAVYAGLAAVLGQRPETGIVLARLGTVLAALGWAFTAWPRFTRKRPKPASDIPRVEQGIRIAPAPDSTLGGWNSADRVKLAPQTPSASSTVS